MKNIMNKKLFVLLAVVLLSIVPTVLSARAVNTLAMVDNLDLAYKAALERLGSSDGFNNPNSTLLIVSDADGNTTAPLCAVMEREALVSLNKYASFKAVKTSAELGFVYNGLDDDILLRLDRLGIDRVLSISSSLDNQRLILDIRAIWLEGGSFADVMAEKYFYPQVSFRIPVKQSSNWVLLGRPSDIFASQTETFARKVLFQTQGKVLDISYGDVNSDGLGDIVLLFDKHLELWLANNNGFSFRYSFDFSATERVRYLPRFITGDIEICKTGNDQYSDVFFMTNQLASGLQLRWEDNKLVEMNSLSGAPLACVGGRIVLGNYKKSSHSFDGRIRVQSEFGEQVIDSGQDFLSLVPVKSGRDWLLVKPDGSMFLAIEKRKVQGDCGIHPAITRTVNNEIVACGISETEPEKDAARFLTVLMPSLKEVYRMDYEQGAIWGFAALSSWKGDAFFSVRYDEQSNKSIIEKYQH